MELRKDDFIYYKYKMLELIKTANENGFEVCVKDVFGLTHIFFKNDSGCAGVAISNRLDKK